MMTPSRPSTTSMHRFPEDNSMNILILHRVPYPRIDYARGIDHQQHDVTYFGKRQALDTLPTDLRCKTIERAGHGSAFDEARDWLSREPRSFDRIISLSEYELLDAAQLRELLGIPGARVEQVRLVRDKVAMKSVVEQAGLRVPRFQPLHEFLATEGHVPWRATVLKPHSGASSADVVVFESGESAFQAITERRTGVARLDADQQQIAEYQVEEFVAGPIVHFDGLVAPGRIAAIMASRYIGTCLDFARGRPLGSYHVPLTANANSWVQKVLRAVGITTGSFHLEAIESNGLVFLEVGNRVGGADVVATFERATGVHLPSQELRLLLGGHVELTARSQQGPPWFGWFVYPGHHIQSGVFGGFDHVDQFRSSQQIVAWNELAPGTPFRADVTYSAHEAPLAGMVATEAPWETRSFMEKLFATATLRIRSAATSSLKEVA